MVLHYSAKKEAVSSFQSKMVGFFFSSSLIYRPVEYINSDFINSFSSAED